jgi:putative spermidine/putrescine transport system ATP-binding protein
MGEAHEPIVRLERVTKRFDEVEAVKDLDIEIARGQFVTLLGPSGCGKSTTLRMIGGFERPSEGRILIAGEDVTLLPPNKRDVNMVFQDYALFPHMNVLDNVAYGLMVRGMPRAERHAAAREALHLVKLEGFDTRRPAQLSGGQRQRVALARSLMTKPKVLLLDEPLGALDLKLREQMQVELKSLQRDLGITFIFVTHDQGEALSMSDRVAVFNDGTVVQVGTPEDIYERPASPFVADFVGGSNVIAAADLPALGLGDGLYSLRPEAIAVVSRAPANRMSVSGTVETVQYQGASRRLSVRADGASFSVLQPAVAVKAIAVGATVTLAWKRSDMHAMAAP